MPEKWLRLSTLLCGIFFRSGVFTPQSRGDKPFSLQLLKYSTRVMKKFPHVRSPPDVLTSDLDVFTAVWIRAFSAQQWAPLQRAHSHGRTEARRVGRNELSRLWSQRRSKAIPVIEWLCVSQPPPCPSDITAIHHYNDNKCKNNRPSDSLPLPPWHREVLSPNPPFLPNTSHFTLQEVENVLHSLPNNKASGIDGVTYETLKSKVRL